MADFNLDARQEVRLENDRLIALVRPATGGQVYELDVRHALTNVLATLERRPEAYHKAIAAAAAGGNGTQGPASDQDRVILKQEGLDRLLVYDRTPRKALVDHFYPIDATLDDLIACRDVERGDFVRGAYLSRVQRGPRRVALIMERPGRAGDHAIHIHKTIELAPDRTELEVHYVLEDLPAGIPLHFAVEINLAAMAGHAPDRYYRDAGGKKLGMLDTRLDLPRTEGVSLTDEWLDLSVGLQWSSPAGLWGFPDRNREPERRRFRRGVPELGRDPALDDHRGRIAGAGRSGSGGRSIGPSSPGAMRPPGRIAEGPRRDRRGRVNHAFREGPCMFWPLGDEVEDSLSRLRGQRRGDRPAGATASVPGPPRGRLAPGRGLSRRPAGARAHVRGAAELRAGRRRPPPRLERHGAARKALRPPVRRGATLTLWLIVDVSASLRFGLEGKTKADRAAQAAALLATAAIQNGDRVGLTLVSDRVEAELPPAGGTRHLAQMVRALVATPAASQKTQLYAALPAFDALRGGR